MIKKKISRNNLYESCLIKCSVIVQDPRTKKLRQCKRNKLANLEFCHVHRDHHPTLINKPECAVIHQNMHIRDKDVKNLRKSIYDFQIETCENTKKELETSRNIHMNNIHQKLKDLDQHVSSLQ